MPSLVDTHSHIYVDRFADDIEQVIANARQAGVEAIVVPTTKPSEIPGALALAERFEEVRVAAGVHPHHAHEVDDADLAEIERLAMQRKLLTPISVKALGRLRSGGAGLTRPERSALQNLFARLEETGDAARALLDS